MGRRPRCCGARACSSPRSVNGQRPARRLLAIRPRPGVRTGPGMPLAAGTTLAGLLAENQRLTRELARSQAVVEIMGRLQGLLEAITESTDTPLPSARR